MTIYCDIELSEADIKRGLEAVMSEKKYWRCKVDTYGIIIKGAAYELIGQYLCSADQRKQISFSGHEINFEPWEPRAGDWVRSSRPDAPTVVLTEAWNRSTASEWVPVLHKAPGFGNTYPLAIEKKSENVCKKCGGTGVIEHVQVVTDKGERISGHNGDCDCGAKSHGPMKCKEHGIRYGIDSSCPRCEKKSKVVEAQHVGRAIRSDREREIGDAEKWIENLIAKKAPWGISCDFQHFSLLLTGGTDGSTCLMIRRGTEDRQHAWNYPYTGEKLRLELIAFLNKSLDEIWGHADPALAATDPALTGQPENSKVHAGSPAKDVVPGECQGCGSIVGVVLWPEGHWCFKCRAPESETKHRADGQSLTPEKSWVQALYDDRIANRNRDIEPPKKKDNTYSFTIGVAPDKATGMIEDCAGMVRACTQSIEDSIRWRRMYRQMEKFYRSGCPERQCLCEMLGKEHDRLCPMYKPKEKA